MVQPVKPTFNFWKYDLGDSDDVKNMLATVGDRKLTGSEIRAARKDGWYIDLQKGWKVGDATPEYNTDVFEKENKQMQEATPTPPQPTGFPKKERECG